MANPLPMGLSRPLGNVRAQGSTDSSTCRELEALLACPHPASNGLGTWGKSLSLSGPQPSHLQNGLSGPPCLDLWQSQALLRSRAGP